MTGQRSVARRLFLWLVVAGLAGVVILVLVMRSAIRHEAPHDDSSPLDVTVTIGQQTFAMKDGVAGTLRTVGAPVTGDVDGKPAAALLLRDEPGGSGTFYYAVLAVEDGGGYRASSAVALGDRIKPQGIDYDGGRFAYRFLERRDGEPMAAQPTVERTVVVRFDPVTGRIAPVS